MVRRQLQVLLEKDRDMNKKLFIGGLSWGIDSELLRDAFSRFGEIEDARVITDRETGRSRGFGFVTFEDPAAASDAISEMDGQELEGRSIKVTEAQEKPRRDNDRGGNNRW